MYVQIATETQLADRARMEQTIEDLEAALQSVCDAEICPTILLCSNCAF